MSHVIHVERECDHRLQVHVGVVKRNGWCKLMQRFMDLWRCQTWFLNKTLIFDDLYFFAIVGHDAVKTMWQHNFIFHQPPFGSMPEPSWRTRDEQRHLLLAPIEEDLSMHDANSQEWYLLDRVPWHRRHCFTKFEGSTGRLYRYYIQKHLLILLFFDSET